MQSSFQFGENLEYIILHSRNVFCPHNYHLNNNVQCCHSYQLPPSHVLHIFAGVVSEDKQVHRGNVYSAFIKNLDIVLPLRGKGFAEENK